MMQLTHPPPGLLTATMILVALPQPPRCESKVVGITIDVEGNIQGAMSNPGPATAILDALTNATSMLRSEPALGLRFSAAVQESWAFHPVSYPPGRQPRPGHEAVLDIIDEAIVMAYDNGCNDPLSSPSAPCASVYAIFWSAPWLIYAHTVQILTNQTRWVTIGVGATTVSTNASAPRSPRLSTELEMETYMNQTLTAMRIVDSFRNVCCFQRRVLFQHGDGCAMPAERAAVPRWPP